MADYSLILYSEGDHQPRPKEYRMASTRTVVLGTSSYFTDNGEVRERTTLVQEAGINTKLVFRYISSNPELSFRQEIDLTPAMLAKLVAKAAVG